MNLDRIVFILLFLAALIILVYSAVDLHNYPYFLTSSIVVAVSLALFFIFMPVLTNQWYVRLIVVNGIVIILMPVLESGLRWIFVSLLYASLLLATYGAWYLLKLKK
ncbi:hypothetical protein JSY36_02010 [Bacillus sp. H-16]|uniref:hypothetical protein n=1 Tax=Alteribacter salitolerans TaxID=2912333 RepID=UPI0019624943|nr:hypothetical protein [Alteribacter salitolerans]MBM7094517.1 hypothetical protein [Alteribacter salitolerans]